MLRLALPCLCIALFLVKLGPTFGQPLPYELIFERTRASDLLAVTLRCRDTSVGTFVDISDVNFWLNRTQQDDQDLRERSDLVVPPGQTGDGLTFSLTRSIEGLYTCGRRTDSANVEESSAVVLVVLQIFRPQAVRFVETFYAMSQTRTILRCPLQPGALVSYYYGSWERDGETLVEIPAPNNGNPQDIVRSDARYDLDRTTFSLIINSVEPNDADSSYQCILSVFNPAAPMQQFVSLQTEGTQLSLMVNEAPVILTGPNDVTLAFNGDSSARQPSFSCAVAGLPAPNVIWTYRPNLDNRGNEISLTDGENYQVVGNVSEMGDGRLVTTSTVTFLNLVITDGGLVRCRTGSSESVADALFTVIGEPDHIDVLRSTRGEFIYDVALPVLLQHPVRLSISYVDDSRQSTSPARLTTTEFNETRSILYREVDTGQLPFEKYFVRIAIVAEFGNRRIEGAAFTSSELIDTTMPSAQVVIFGLSGGIATALLIILVFLPCVTSLGCCIYHRNKGCCGGRCCSDSSNVV